jgi:hypothetical protein
MYLKVFLSDEEAADEEEGDIQPLHIISKWMPTEIPYNITYWIGNY